MVELYYEAPPDWGPEANLFTPAALKEIAAFEVPRHLLPIQLRPPLW